MSRVALSTLPDGARVWLFGSSKPVAGSEREQLASSLDQFLNGWASHGAAVAAGFEWLEDRFLLVAVDEEMHPSGCSIDKLFRKLSEIEQSIGAGLLDSSLVYFRGDQGGVRGVTREEFTKLAGAGDVDLTTIVYDPTVETLGEVRNGAWQRAAGQSWHAQLFERTA